MDSVTQKKCIKCLTEKYIDEFIKSRNTCKLCHSERCKNYRKVNHKKISIQRKKWYQDNSGKAKEKSRKWRQSNPDKVIENNKKYYLRNPEQRREKKREWDKANRWKINAFQKEWRQDNPEKVKLRQKKYRLAHSEIVKEKVRKWFRDNPDKRKTYSNNRRAIELSAEGSFTAKEWRDLCSKHDNKCLCCGEKKKLTADHVLPLTKGGTNYIENIQPLCGSCNSRKGTNTTDYRLPENRL